MKFTVKSTINYCVAIFVALIASIGTAIADVDREADVQKYIAVFTSGTPAQQKGASEALGWEGLSDPRLFDIIEKNLLQNYKSANDRAEADHAAWLAKALGYSGQAKYRATLEEVATTTRANSLRSHARAAADKLLPAYSRWNPIIADNSRAIAGESAEINRFANMIRSNDKGLQEIAARQIIERPINNTLLLDLVQKTVEPDLAKTWANEDDEKSVAFMLKALAGTGQPQYRATVEQAASSAASTKVRKYAERYLKNY